MFLFANPTFSYIASFFSYSRKIKGYRLFVGEDHDRLGRITTGVKEASSLFLLFKTFGFIYFFLNLKISDSSLEP